MAHLGVLAATLAADIGSAPRVQRQHPKAKGFKKAHAEKKQQRKAKQKAQRRNRA